MAGNVYNSVSVDGNGHGDIPNADRGGEAPEMARSPSGGYACERESPGITAESEDDSLHQPSSTPTCMKLHRRTARSSAGLSDPGRFDRQRGVTRPGQAISSDFHGVYP